MATFDWFENESNLKPWKFKLSKQSWYFQTFKSTSKICQGGGKRFGGYPSICAVNMCSEDVVTKKKGSWQVLVLQSLKQIKTSVTRTLWKKSIWNSHIVQTLLK